MPYKQERVAGRIRKILSALIVREIADPRLQGITITEVEIDAELMYAKVFVNALGEEDREAEIMIGLESAATASTSCFPNSIFPKIPTRLQKQPSLNRMMK
jgi:ribosome-binding factor A